MKRMLVALAEKLTGVEGLRSHVAVLKGLVDDQKKKLESHGIYPAGHYYSPVPSQEDVFRNIRSRGLLPREIPGIALHDARQQELLFDFARYYAGIRFPEKQKEGRRYYFENDWFSYSDAIFLHGFLRKYMPKRIVEVGSGFSSAAILDTVDDYFLERPEITFIEPYPDRLMSLLKGTDPSGIQLHQKPVQDIPLDVFHSLESGDLLFVDSSHVVKCGSDLAFLLFDVIPCLRPGVYVHFHDVFYPFDYPEHWLLEGRYWNENYFLRAFLSWNSEWQIVFFNTYVHHVFADQIKESMPMCMKNPGGSLYIQRTSKPFQAHHPSL